MPKLVITDGDGVREVGLKSGDTLGRTTQNAIPLKVAEASRQHCRFTEEKGSWFVEDLGSSNGTLVNGRKVTKFELQDGDVVTIGKVELKFLDAEAAPDVAGASASAWGDDDLNLEERVFLVLGGAKREGEVVELPDGVVAVGRNAKNALALKDASVSGDHAELRRNGSRVSVKDLGSSNGTFVNDRKVTEADLASGDVVRFGTVACTFGVGDPKDFAAPTATADPGRSEAFTRMVDAPDFGDDATFEMSDAAGRKETLWNLLALVAVLVLGGGAAFLFLRQRSERQDGAGSASIERGSNLLPDYAWTFELPEGSGVDVPSWVKLDAADGATLGEVSAPVRTGHVAYRVDRAGTGGKASLAVLDTNLKVSPGTAYRLSVAASGDGAVPIVGVLWLAEARDAEAPVELARELVYGLPSGRDWATTSGVVVSPEGANLARILVGGAGSGEVNLDDVVCVGAELPAGRQKDAQGFRATLGPHGLLRVSRYGRRVIEGLGVEVEHDGRRLAQDELLAVDPSAGNGIAGSLAGGRGPLKAVLEGGQDTIALRLSGTGLGAGHVAIPLVARDGADLQVTVLDGEVAKGFGQSFTGVPATALIVGSGADRAKIHLKTGSGEGLRLEVACEFGGGGAVVRLPPPGKDDHRRDFQLSFGAEEREAQELLVSASQAARDGRSGEALLGLAKIAQRFPFDARVMEEAGRLEAQIQADGRKRLDALRARIDDAEFFRSLGREAVLEKDLAAEVARFSGTPLGAEFAKLEAGWKQTLDTWSKPRREVEAGRILARGKDYLDGGKTPLAALFLRAVTAAYAGTDEAEQAAAFLGRIEQGKKGQ